MKTDLNLAKFIVYACPTGEFNTQLETFFQRSYLACGKNTAHEYMPHCTLTGFFHDDPNSIPDYLQALDLAYRETKDLGLSLEIQIIQLVFNSNWHGLELQAEGIKQLIERFSQLETSLTRQEDIRLKDWLHLSLAYGFKPSSQEELTALAREIDLTADVAWELRFYQKLDANWKCWQSWSLG